MVMSGLAGHQSTPLLAQAVTVLGPSLLGLAGFGTISWMLRRYFARSPAVANLLRQRLALAAEHDVRVRYQAATEASRKRRLGQLLLPLAWLIIYAVWQGLRTQGADFDDPAAPLRALDIQTMLPYLLLIPDILLRDRLVSRILRTRHPEWALGEVPVAPRRRGSGLGDS
jgi:hypothetical protein